ncbi:GerMN domain-containing protein [Rhabdothermincola sediminis]|uniref:GerMN domain-containing protein n=1 Tax=Rhabdothermincola sediminis TaxID=2751370 RepID=UPI001AA0400E|nr:GerMN domain-containing protein [Rhabdothermincola sediminis]
MSTPDRYGRRRGRSVAALVAVGSVLAAAACGIPADEEPRSIPVEALPANLSEQQATTTTVLDEASAQRETIYLVHTGTAPGGAGESLEPVSISLRNPEPDQLPRLVIERLIATKPDQIGLPGLTNPVPADTKVLDARVSDGVLDLDLSASLANIESALQRLALAQIVFTATDITSLPISSVRFRIDGQPVAVPVEVGTAPAGQPVSRNDYPRFKAQVDSLQEASR